ncbi:protein FAM53C [Callorhinchus milii]|uniref:Family with sequence similarity 53 member C n=2 Tax=Callorhinchus milii TaxID=7868 RepID=A0A4W3JV86_CALMI|nr:protein FAM53C [Callorhinchus milii]XP_007889559.1 protein FAM53C [Callorhinchus milii]XP_007889560.1 protein FAM53C [Callorhinchus milii]XP_007889562.1 protein FAM53C [Callorhinchus milii]|eukprot:gi/632948351/ref/XP_007889558.1/ PREDICTED: protein FAM53C [Callorhinchus milii]
MSLTLAPGACLLDRTSKSCRDWHCIERGLVGFLQHTTTGRKFTMVTVITEQLQKQSLDDLACKALNFNLPLPENTNQGGCWNPYHFIPEERKWNVLNSRAELPVKMGFPSLVSYNLNGIEPSRQSKSSWTRQVTSTSVGNLNDLHFFESSALLPAPPTKRHCRSLSVPEDLSHCRSLWKPSSSKVWIPVKRRCNSGGTASAQLCAPTQRPSNLGLPQPPLSSLHSNGSFTFSSLTASPESPLPWTLSPGHHSTEAAERTFLGIQCILPEQCEFLPQRRFSLSPVHIHEATRCLMSAKSTPSSTPEMNRRQQGLLRSHSQPCDLNERKCGIKRRHDEDVRWARPALDFFKMTQMRNLSSPACVDPEEREPRKFTSLSVSRSPACALERVVCPLDLLHGCPASNGKIETLSESEEEEEDRKGFSSTTEESPFQRNCEDLDLEMIEEN